MGVAEREGRSRRLIDSLSEWTARLLGKIEEEILAQLDLLLGVVGRRAAFNHGFVHLVFAATRTREEGLDALAVAFASLAPALLPGHGVAGVASVASRAALVVGVLAALAVAALVVGVVRVLGIVVVEKRVETCLPAWKIGAMALVAHEHLLLLPVLNILFNSRFRL